MIDDNVMQSDKDLEMAINSFYNERNSLRRFLTGLTATTFGVLVALHPKEFASYLSGDMYIVSVVLNAVSVISFIISTFGRYFMLKNAVQNQEMMMSSAMQGKKYVPANNKCAKAFGTCSIIGIYSYMLAIIISCVFLIVEVWGKC